MFKAFLLTLIRFYQRFVSSERSLLGYFTGGRICRFHPSCSQYMAEAVNKHGATQGFWLGLKRLSCCHPWNPGGYDPVP